MHHHKHFVDSVRLSEESQYNLHSMKEISVTHSFMGLDRKSRNCQSIETYYDCITRYYVDNMMQKCGCLPLSHIKSDQVSCIQIKGVNGSAKSKKLSLILF